MKKETLHGNVEDDFNMNIIVRPCS